MNTLAYGLLSILIVAPHSGYDLMLRLKQLWQAKHSQIYPLLAKLEQMDLVRHELVKQSNKPDKKVYSITDAGREAVIGWLGEEAAEPVTKDEFNLKMFALYAAEPQVALKRLAERERLYADKLDRLKLRFEELRRLSGGNLDEITVHSPYFGPYALLRKSEAAARANLEWCRWVIRTYRNQQSH